MRVSLEYVISTPRGQVSFDIDRVPVERVLTGVDGTKYVLITKEDDIPGIILFSPDDLHIGINVGRRLGLDPFTVELT